MQSSGSPNDCVLVIDDDVVMRELLSLLLDEEGRTVLTAESGKDALDLLAGLAPDKLPSVLLTDLRMPGLSEAALARRLRRICRPPAVLIAMSGSNPIGGEDQFFDAFLQKPFTVAELDAALERARTRAPGKPKAKSRAKRGVDLAASTGDFPEKGVPVLDETIYEKLLSVMGRAQLPQLYTLFMNDAPGRITRMRAAVAGNDAATFGREAHAIKGGCGMLGATEIHTLSGQMEAGGLSCSPLLDDFEQAFERLRRILNERAMIV